MSYYRNWLFYAILLIGCISVYYSSLFHNFTYLDDYAQVVENTNIQSISFASLKDIFSSTSVGMYQPITTSLYALIYLISGLNPIGFHIASLIIHILNAVLVLKLLNHFIKDYKINYLLVLIFTLHPMQVESIAWVSAFSNLVFTCFFLASTLFYLNYLEKEKRSLLFLSLGFFIFACLSKSAAVILPIFLILIDFYKSNSIKKEFIINKIPFLLISFLIGTITILSRETAGHLSDLSISFNWFDRIFLISHSILFYPLKFILPTQLSAFYPYPELNGTLLPFSYYLSLPALIIGSYLVYKLRAQRMLLFSIGFFLLSIALVLQIIPVGNQLTTDRYIYLPMVGFLLLLGYLITQNLNPKYFNLLFILPFILGYMSFEQSKNWENDEKLWKSVLNNYPNVSQAYNNLGSYALENNRPKEAFEYFNSAIKLQANYADAYSNRGNLYSQNGKSVEAIQDFNKAIALRPHADAYFNRANEFSKMGNMNAAIEDYSASLALTERADTYTNRAFNYLKIGNLNDAQKDLNNALELNPSFNRTYFLLGLVEQQNGNTEKACATFRKAIQLGSENAKLAFTTHCR